MHIYIISNLTAPRQIYFYYAQLSIILFTMNNSFKTEKIISYMYKKNMFFFLIILGSSDVLWDTKIICNEKLFFSELFCSSGQIMELEKGKQTTAFKIEGIKIYHRCHFDREYLKHQIYFMKNIFLLMNENMSPYIFLSPFF